MSPQLYECPGCHNYFAFQEYHWPHCPGNPANLTGETKKIIESKFTKAELATISTQGAVPDKKIGNTRKHRRR